MDRANADGGFATATPARKLDHVTAIAAASFVPTLWDRVLHTSAEQSGVRRRGMGSRHLRSCRGRRHLETTSRSTSCGTRPWTSPTRLVGRGRRRDRGRHALPIGPEYTNYTNGNLYFSILAPCPGCRVLGGEGKTTITQHFRLRPRAALGKRGGCRSVGMGMRRPPLEVSLNQDSGSNPPTGTSWAFTCAFSPVQLKFVQGAAWRRRDAEFSQSGYPGCHN